MDARPRRLRHPDPERVRMKHAIHWDRIHRLLKHENLFRRTPRQYISVNSGEAEKWWLRLGQSGFTKPPYALYTLRYRKRGNGEEEMDQTRMKPVRSREYIEKIHERHERYFLSALEQMNRQQQILRAAVMRSVRQQLPKKVDNRTQVLDWHISTYTLNQQLFRLYEERGKLLEATLKFYIDIEPKGKSRTEKIRSFSKAIKINDNEKRAMKRGMEISQKFISRVYSSPVVEERTAEIAKLEKDLEEQFKEFEKRSIVLAAEKIVGETSDVTWRKERESRLKLWETFLRLTETQWKAHKTYGVSHSTVRLGQLRKEIRSARKRVFGLRKELGMD